MDLSKFWIGVCNIYAWNKRLKLLISNVKAIEFWPLYITSYYQSTFIYSLVFHYKIFLSLNVSVVRISILHIKTRPLTVTIYLAIEGSKWTENAIGSRGVTSLTCSNASYSCRRQWIYLTQYFLSLYYSCRSWYRGDFFSIFSYNFDIAKSEGHRYSLVTTQAYIPVMFYFNRSRWRWSYVHVIGLFLDLCVQP